MFFIYKIKQRQEGWKGVLAGRLSYHMSSYDSYNIEFVKKNIKTVIFAVLLSTYS